MNKLFRVTPSRLAIGYIALGVLALAILAIPLWYAWKVNLSTLKVYVEDRDVRGLVHAFDSGGAPGLVAAIDARARSLSRDEVLVLADASKHRLAGNLSAWPAEVPDEPGTYGLGIGLGDGSSMRVVAAHVALPDGHHLLTGRESIRFESLVQLFWYDIAGATVLVLALGVVAGWLIRRALLSEVQEVSRTATAIAGGDYSRRVPSHGRSDALGTLARTVNGMLDQLASQNVRLEDEVAVRRRAEEALHRAHDELEGLVAQRTAQLARANERYALTVEAAGEGHSDWNIETGEFYVSPRLLEICGYAPGTTFKDRADWLARYPFHPEDRPKWEKAVEAHLAGTASRFDMEVRIRVRGKTRWVRLVFLSSRDASGKPIRWTGSTTDITDRKNAAEALRLSEDRYARAMEGSDAGHWDWNVVTDEMFVSERASEMLALPADTDLPRTRSEIMALVPMHPDDRSAMHAIVRASIGSGRHEREYRVVPRPGELRWLRARAKIYHDARGAAVRMTGSLTDITEPRLAADALRKSEARYARAMEAAGDGHSEWNLETGEFYVSPRQLEICGYAPGTTFKDREEWVRRYPFHPEDRAKWEAAVAAHFAGREARFQMELRIVVRGETRWVSSTRVAERDASGRPIRWTGATTDITERKRSELALAESEARFRNLTEISSDFYWETDAGHRYTLIEFGEAYVGIRDLSLKLGRARWEIPSQIPSPTPDEAGWAAHRAVMDAHQRFFDFGFSRVEPDQERFYEISGEPRFDAQGGFLGYRGVGRDVTERKRAERALRNSEERYARAMEASGDGHSDWNIETGEYYLSPRYLDLTGLPRDTTFRDRAEWVQAFPFHPEDRAKWEAAVAAHFAGRGTRFIEEFRVVVRGETRWLEATYLCRRDAAGRPTRWTSSCSDITERKRAEEELRRSEQYLAEAQRLSHIGSWSFNAVGFGYWSRELFKIHGLDPGGKAPSIPEYLALVHPEDRDFVVREIETMLAGAPGFDFTKRIVRPDGAIRHVRCVGIRASTGGMVPEFVGSGMDVTEQERAQEELRKSEERYALALEVSEEGHFEADLETDEMFVSARMNEINGFPRCAKITNRLEYASQIPFHPDDRRLLADIFRRESEDRAHDGYEFECRIVPRPGETCWVHTRSKVIRDAEGRARRRIGVVTDITARKLAEEERREHLWFLESMDRINRAMQRTNDVEGMMSGVLEETLAIFGSDRAWLVYPCDPDAATSRVVMEHTRPEYPGAFGLGEDFPVDTQAAEQLRRVLEGPGAATDLSISPEVRERFGIQSIIAIAVRPKGDRPYLFGLHQCSHARAWTAAERRLFEEITRRLEDALTSVLAHRNLLASDEELRRSRAYLAEAQRVSHTGSWAWNNVTRETVYWSEECFRIHGRDPAQGPPPLEQVLADIHPDDVPGIVASLEKALHEGLEWEGEYRLTNFADGPRTVRSIAHPVPDPSGRAVEYIGTVVDITKQKRAEQELRTSELERARAEHALHDAREKLAQASKIASLAELSATIAHEINQPLQAVVSAGDASLRWLDAAPPNIDKARRSAERVVRDGKAAAEVVHRIRALFKRVAPAKVDLDINKLILQVGTLMADEIQGNGVSLETSLGEGVPTIGADAVQIQQVIVNLVRNAIEAMAATMARPKPLWIRSRLEGGEVVIEVRDHGPGLADAEKVFEPFVTTKKTGMGMGLAICRSIIEAHEGRIWFARNEDRGMTFSFSLPIQQDDD